ncbi:MAG: bifunctional phosphoribosylaminoimidazolecarboxamide formyltransferase/IMP cyclohydrolase [Deltaproteobacteria bacterium]|uniref:Bifunctional purine biosynthesis protein PurH n=1 Tax=Candidatus Zymogenus saltonus TaxID=2844893 RepID=A0A9D8KDW6_9DELT|nr:bifunctional phosphoribosylaminoimidazolecarboxamide formyltransferase/IMP cyclohydrolase [Candidatus Zymogenus saltonus]
MAKIKTALISVSDKSGLLGFARKLASMGVKFISTGGTGKLLSEGGLDVTDISKYTGFPEMMDGRLKTLHPKVHGGLLAIRDNDEHMEKVREHDMTLIDMVVVNLYQFEKTVANPDVKIADAIENIDIGGPTMIRAAAKNYKYVTVIEDPADYDGIIAEMEKNDGAVSEATNFDLAKKVFVRTAAYDGAISNYLTSLNENNERVRFPESLTLQFRKVQPLRYGENPHQQATFYRDNETYPATIPSAEVLQGKELSYNNIMDTDAAMDVVREFDDTAAVIIKHANPCGVAVGGQKLVETYRKARETDPISAFGGIVAFNREVDQETAEVLVETFLEVIVAPGFSKEARDILASKQNMRLIVAPAGKVGDEASFNLRRVHGGILVQDWDTIDMGVRGAKVATKRAPTEDEWAALELAWRVTKHVKSNAIVFARIDNKVGQLVGVGAGQMSRVDSVKIARMKAQLPTEGCVMGSDAFFPQPDGIEAAAEAGITAVVQPGGSIKDDEAVKAADKNNIAMVFTGKRHFRH